MDKTRSAPKGYARLPLPKREVLKIIAYDTRPDDLRDTSKSRWVLLSGYGTDSKGRCKHLEAKAYLKPCFWRVEEDTHIELQFTTPETWGIK